VKHAREGFQGRLPGPVVRRHFVLVVTARRLLEKERLYTVPARPSAHLADAEPAGAALEPSADELAWLAQVLGVVRGRNGLDFGAYRPAILLRRLRTRMIAAGARTFDDYLERLRADPAEADALVEKLTIKVSRFFRDPATFEAIGRALQSRRAEEPGHRLQVWSAGCGLGEEPYGLAMLLDQLEPPADDGEVVGTDIDPAALVQAARGCYPASAVEGLDPTLRARYFEERAAMKGTAFCIGPELRGRVSFLRHDVAASRTTPDGRRFDLVCCRNVLIYLQPPAQLGVEALLAAALRPGGLLCLGEAEWLLPPVAAAFDVVDRKARLFRRRDGTASGETP
jgi:chemotaxis protein methyltransferase CheR